MCLPRSLRRPIDGTTTMTSTKTSTGTGTGTLTGTSPGDSTDAVTEHVAALQPPMREIAERLVALVDAELPGAERVLWHGHPVWRLGGEPAVLVKAYPKHVTLGFWRGQRIAGDGLTPGAREMASVKVTGDIDGDRAGGWLRRVAALHPATS